MDTTALALALAGFATVIATWAAYMATIPGGTVPARPVAHVAAQIAGTALAIAGLVWGAQDGRSPGAAVIAPATVALVMGPLFLFILSQRKTPVGDIRVSVGDPLPAFLARTASGAEFHTDSLAKRRVLLKFFRGGW